MPIFDALADVLQTLRLQTAVFSRAQLTAPWGVEISKEYGYSTKFHIVVKGRCWLQVEGWQQPIALSEGDLDSSIISATSLNVAIKFFSAIRATRWHPTVEIPDAVADGNCIFLPARATLDVARDCAASRLRFGGRVQSSL